MGIILEMKSNMYVLLTVLKKCAYLASYLCMSAWHLNNVILKKTSVVMNFEDVLYLVNRNHVPLPTHIRRHRFTEIKYFT